MLWRALGVIALLTFYDAVLARLLIAAGRADEARCSVANRIGPRRSDENALLRRRVAEASRSHHR